MPSVVYHIRPACASDVQDIHALVFANPGPHIRRLSVQDVRDLVKDGVFWLACDEQGRLVGTSYVRVPLSEPGVTPEPAEYGGAFVLKECRRLGLGTALAQLALAHYFWDNERGSLDHCSARAQSSRSRWSPLAPTFSLPCPPTSLRA